MKTKILLLSLLGSLLFGNLCLAQKKQNVYFLKDDGTAVKLKDSADYVRVIQEPDSGSTFYNLFEYYPDQQKKRIGKLSSFEPNLIFEESMVSFYPNGKRKEITNYKRGKPVGLRYFYYKNGQLERTIVNIESKDQPDILGSKIKFISYYDSTGVQLIEDGNGYYKHFDKKESSFEEGKYTEGLKDGVWKGTYEKSKESYEELYDKGKFISGLLRSQNGDSTAYAKEEELPTFKGGMKSFYEFVGRTYKYPPAAQRAGVSGRVMISFVVEKNGTLSSAKVVKDFGYGTGEEALKLIERSPKWIPGYQHGRPVRVVYNLPLVLNMR